MILYRAGFDLSHLPRDNRYWHTIDQMLDPSAFTIIFRELDCKQIDKNNHRLLLVQEDGTEKWYGPWAPYSDIARDKIDAVHLLRWDNHSTSFRPGIDPTAFGGKEEFQKWKQMFAHRHEVCVRWLIDHGVKKSELWDPLYWNDRWHPRGNNPAPRWLPIP